MKYIEKGEEPKSFLEWKAKVSEDWTPSWDNLQSPEKKELHEALLREQGYICCYCEMRIAQKDSHIEHFKPKKDYPELALEYNNLLASCQRERKRLEPKRCGVKKDDWYDEQLMVSPLEVDCADFFRYTEDGMILPTKDPEKQKAAAETIERLGLNSDKLMDNRSQVIEDILEYIDEGELTDIRELSDRYEQRNTNGEYNEFCTVVIYILKQYVPNPD